VTGSSGVSPITEDIENQGKSETPEYAFNAKDVRQFYTLLGHYPQEWTELRIIDPNKKKVVDRAWVNNQRDFVSFCEKWNGKANVYVGLNPRPSNTASLQNEIKRVTLIPLDVDPEHPKDEPSNEKELKWALDEGRKIVDFLKEREFSDPYVAMSGNGIHIIKSVDIKVENYEEIREQIKRYFTKLPVKVDHANCDLTRVFKVPGTWSVKGEHTKERPHRQAYILMMGSVVPDNSFQRWLMKLEPGEGQKLFYPGIQEKIKKGSRNTELFRLAGSMRTKGMEYEEIFAALKVVNENRCDPPLDLDEVKAISKNIIGYDAGEVKLSWREDDPGRYFEDITKTKKVFLYDIMTRDILEEKTLITFKDTDKTWVYKQNEGLFDPNGVPEIKTFILKKLGKYFKKTYSEETIYQLKIMTYVNREDVEPPEDFLHLKNGILNISNRTLIPHDPGWFFINGSQTEYNPDAKAPVFHKLLSDIDCKKVKTLQEFCGYLLEDTPKYKKAGFIHGPTDSGKTTFTDAIIGTIGESCVSNVPLQTMDNRFQIKRLYKMKANICGDLGSEAFSKVGTFRRTTGGDLLEAEIKGSNNTIKFVWGGKHLFDANDLPDTKGDADSDAFYNRLQLFPFSKVIPKEKIDRTLPIKLSEPEEKSGILNWMLDGLDRLEKNQGFTDKTSIDEIREHYKRASNSVYCFANDLCEVVKDYYVVRTESHNRYVEYCIDKGYSPKGRSTFYEELKIQRPAIMPDRKKIGRETPHVWMNLKIEGLPERIEKQETL